MKRRRRLLGLALALLLVIVALAAQPPTPTGFERLTLRYGDRERSYYLHLPPKYDAKKSYPLFILLHGGGGSALQALDSYPLQQVTDREGAILVAPNGSGPFPRRESLLTWNVGFGFGYALEHQVDDTGFVRALILELRKTRAVDPKRVYLTGLSNGAILCHWAAAANSDLVRGIAPVCGTLGGRDESETTLHMPVDPKDPVDVVMFCGALDEHLPIEGGKQKRHVGKSEKVVLSAQASVDFWVRNNGCDRNPVVEELPALQATRKTWKGGKKGTEVVLYILHNQGHAWPGGRRPRAGGDLPTHLLKAHEVMWDFFTR